MRLVFAAAAALAFATAASAQVDRSRPFCADRPGKATPPCTLDPGRWQLELGAYDWTRDRDAGVTTTTLVAAAPTVKLGLTADAELQLAGAPYLRQTVRGGGADGADTGVGDLVVRLKWNLTRNDPDAGVALMPFVKLPTASHGLGNGRIEGGLVMPTAFALPGGWSLGVSPELDLNADAAGEERHVAGAAAAGLGHGVGPVSLGAELWLQRDFVGGARTQATADLTAAWQPAGLKDVQLDAGLNLGLNHATPGAEAYVGVAKRF